MSYFKSLFSLENKSLLIAAPKFSDQLKTVEEISKILPDNYRLYVKEHPTQGPARNWREGEK